MSSLLSVCLSFVLSAECSVLTDTYPLSALSNVCLSVRLFVCEQDYCKINQPISLKLGVMIGPTSRNN